MENENPKRLSIGQLLDRTVTDFLDGKGAWDRRQWLAREKASEVRAEAGRDAQALELKLDGERWRERLGDAAAAHQAAYDRMAVEDPSSEFFYRQKARENKLPADHPFSEPALKAMYAEWGAEDTNVRELAPAAANENAVRDAQSHAVAENVHRLDGAESPLALAENPSAQGREAWQRDGERIRGELGDDPLTHWVAFDRLAVENPAAFEQYKAMENTGQLGRDHPFSHPAGMAVATETLGGPPMSGPTGFALEQAEVRFSDLYDNSDDYDDRQWRLWSKLERDEREQLARDYAAEPTRTDRPFEVQVAYFNMMEAGKAHFESLDEAQQERIKQDFFKRGGQERDPFHEAVYLDIAKSDLAIDQMPLGAIDAGRDAGLPGFQLDHEAEATVYNEYVDGLLAEQAKVVALENGQAIRFDEQTLGYQVAQCALQKEIAARGLGSGHDLDQEHHGAKWSYVESRLEDGGLTHSFKHPNHPRGGNVEFTAKGASPAEVGGLEQLCDDPASAWRGLDDEVKVAILTDHIEEPGNFPHPFEPQIRGEIAALAAIAERHNLVDEIRAAKQERGPEPKEQEHPAEVSLGR
jgi:hypothetical protein